MLLAFAPYVVLLYIVLHASFNTYTALLYPSAPFNHKPLTEVPDISSTVVGVTL